MNPLDLYPQARKALYLVQWLTTGVTGVLGIIFTAQGSVPEWYTITVAALAFVWTYTGLQAQSHVEDVQGKHERTEAGHGNLETVLLVLAILVVAVVLVRVL